MTVTSCQKYAWQSSFASLLPSIVALVCAPKPRQRFCRGSEHFAAELARLGVPAPWELSDETAGEILAANKALACQALDAENAVFDERATHVVALIMVAINTLAVYRADIGP